MYKVSYNRLIVSFIVFGLQVIISCVYTYILRKDWYVLISILSFFVGFVAIIKLIKKAIGLKHLLKYGMLYKSIPFKLKWNYLTYTGKTFETQRPFYRIEIEPTLDDGSVVKLKSLLWFTANDFKKEGIDLLIDPNDKDKYYIDFNIKKISGAKDE